MEIIPNWHPALVHFTVALLTSSTVFYCAGSLLKKEDLLIVARWNLWAGVVITIGTLAAGLYAYNTVDHDGLSHAAMTDHRNWAFLTAGIFAVLALWAFWKQRGARAVHPLFVLAMVLATALLTVTGFKGGEVVYRYGLGVISTPKMRSHDATPRSHGEEESEEREERHYDHHDHHH